MIVITEKGRSYDTEKDLTAAERHILQKLFLWASLARSVEEFREKAKEAFAKGWNNSGPIEESKALREISSHLEKEVARRTEGQGS